MENGKYWWRYKRFTILKTNGKNLFINFWQMAKITLRQPLHQYAFVEITEDLELTDNGKTNEENQELLEKLLNNSADTMRRVNTKRADLEESLKKANEAISAICEALPEAKKILLSLKK